MLMVSAVNLIILTATCSSDSPCFPMLCGRRKRRLSHYGGDVVAGVSPFHRIQQTYAP